MGILLIAGVWMAGQFGIPFTDLWIVWGWSGSFSSSSWGWSVSAAPG